MTFTFIYTFSLQPLNYINYIWIIKYKGLTWRLCGRLEVKINAVLTLALHTAQWSVSYSSWSNPCKTKPQQPLHIKLGGLRSWSGHEDEYRLPAFVMQRTAIIQTTATFTHSHTHTHTHNQLNITNQSEMTRQSDHANEGCAPKKKKNIKNEIEGSERFFP
jgi:hypothetical protein